MYPLALKANGMTLEEIIYATIRECLLFCL